MVEKECDKCKTAVIRKQGNWMICEGFCSRIFHSECISLTESDQMTCITRNILWFCDECLPKLWVIKNRESNNQNEADVCENRTHHSEGDTIEDQIAMLKSDIANINDALQKVVSQSTNTDHGNIGSSDTTSHSPDAAHSSRLLCGSKGNSPSFTGCCTSSPASRFWMYLTRISSIATENDVRNMVRESLQCDNGLIVRKLVPPWKDASTMDYISFKVGIPSELQNLAMKPSTWPEGLRFREFLNEKNSIWEPSLVSS